MRLRNSLIRVRDKGALIATPARSHLADRGSKTAEIEARKGKVTPRNKAISAPSCITTYRDFGAKYPEKWCFQGTWCEANSVPWKSRLARPFQIVARVGDSGDVNSFLRKTWCVRT